MNVKLLDCTLRDGGFRLDDAESNGEKVRHFDPETVEKLLDDLCASGVDIIELGAVETPQDKRGLSIYPSIEEISKIMPERKAEGPLFAALYRDPNIPTADIPTWRPGLCDIVRVIIRYSEMRKSLDFCGDIARKGYKVFIQPALTMRYTQDEIQLLIDTANDIGVYALYFVDTYGYMQADDVRAMFYRYDKYLDPSIRIGFHAHNNVNLAFSNVQAFLSLETERDRIIDSCLLGMGQGAGNMQTELITDYMNSRYGRAFDYDAVLDACELIEAFGNKSVWGYSVTNLLPAIHRVAYKYAAALRDRYGLSYVDINHIFLNIPDELRHRYTPQNAVKLLEMFHYPVEEKK